MYEFIKEMKSREISLPVHGALEYLPDLEVASLRRENMFLCVKGGNNMEHHNHNDVGSFVLYDGGDPVLIDVGIGVYTRFTFDNSTRYSKILWTQSLYHNLPVINGVAQKYGKAFRSSAFEVDNGTVRVSFAEAYPDKAGVDSALRKITLTDGGMSLTDRFEAAKAPDVTECFMTALPVRVEENRAYIGEKYVLEASVGEVSAEFVSFDGDANLKIDWKTEGVTRISVKAEGAASVMVLLNTVK